MNVAPTVFCLVAALLAAHVPPTLGQDSDNDRRDPDRSRPMSILDTDGDGTISLEEIKAEQGRLIGAADVDGNGQLSVDEFRRRGGWFRRLGTTTLLDLMDADGDQSLTADEIAGPSERWFLRYDANGDGQIDEAELPQDRRRHSQR